MSQKGGANSELDLGRIVAFGKTMGHILRVRILLHVGRAARPISPRMLACEVPDDTPQTIAYHVRVMAVVGVLEETNRTVRGATAEHFYTLTSVGRDVLQVIRQIGTAEGRNGDE